MFTLVLNKEDQQQFQQYDETTLKTGNLAEGVGQAGVPNIISISQAIRTSTGAIDHGDYAPNPWFTYNFPFTPSNFKFSANVTHGTVNSHEGGSQYLLKPWTMEISLRIGFVTADSGVGIVNDNILQHYVDRRLYVTELLSSTLNDAIVALPANLPFKLYDVSQDLTAQSTDTARVLWMKKRGVLANASASYLGNEVVFEDATEYGDNNFTATASVLYEAPRSLFAEAEAGDLYWNTLQGTLNFGFDRSPFYAVGSKAAYEAISALNGKAAKYLNPSIASPANWSCYCMSLFENCSFKVYPTLEYKR